MSDITRDDLRKEFRVRNGALSWLEWEPVTDEEFDRLAREAGYISVQNLVDRHVDMLTLFPQSLSESGKRKLLRALLTDECDYPGCQSGEIETLGPDHTDPCPKCDGRGWLPKDGVLFADWNFGDTDEALAIRLDWLEAEE